MNTPLLANAEPVFLLSVYKPILYAIFLALWARAVGAFDYDLKSNYLPRQQWNFAQMIAGLMGFGVWLILPFWLGLFLALLVAGGTIGAYVYWRNTKVRENRRWTLKSLTKFNHGLNAQPSRVRANEGIPIDLLDANGNPSPLPDIKSPNYPAHQSIDLLLAFMLANRAERFELATDGQTTSVTAVIDGTKYPQEALDGRTGLAMIDYIKTFASLDVTDRRRKQTGRLAFSTQGDRHSADIVTQGSTRGVTLVGEIDSHGRRDIKFDQLGLLEAQKQQLVPVLDNGTRAVIVASPPGQGMTTTLYALMGRHDAFIQNLVVIEDSHEHEIEGVKAELIEPGATTDAINQKVKTHVLRDANAILLSRVNDASTAAAIAEWSKEIRFYVGLRQDDALTAVRAWVKAVGNPKKAAESLGAVLSQKLVRRLCTNCRVPYKPDPEALRRLNLPPDKVGQFYKHSGQIIVRDKPQPCPLCQGVGYRGRIAIFEVMVFDDEARALTAAGQFDQLRALLRRQRMLLLQEAALMKVVAGETSISEVSQATREKQP